MSSLHKLYNHTPSAPLRPPPELCCGFTHSYSHYLVSDRSPTGGSTVRPVAQAVRRAQRSDLARSGLAPPLFIPNGPNYHPTPNPSHGHLPARAPHCHACHPASIVHSRALLGQHDRRTCAGLLNPFLKFPLVIPRTWAATGRASTDSSTRPAHSHTPSLRRVLPGRRQLASCRHGARLTLSS